MFNTPLIGFLTIALLPVCLTYTSHSPFTRFTSSSLHHPLRSPPCFSSTTEDVPLTAGNVKLDGILNLRDLATVNSKVKPRKLIRTGCISRASDSDVLSFLLLSYS